MEDFTKKIKKCVLSNKLDHFTKDSIINEIGITRIQTGFDEIDKMLSGGMTPGLTVLGATSGLGKSTFILQMAENISASGIPVLYFSLEMSSTMIAAKSINRQLYLDSRDRNMDAHRYNAMNLTNPDVIKNFSDTTWKDIARSREIAQTRSNNLYILDMENTAEKDLTAEGIYEYVKSYIEHHKDGKKPFVIVDYLQILKPNMNDYKGDKLGIETCIGWMTKIHQKYKTSVILISSLSRASYEQKVQQDSFKETGAIEYSSDVLLGLSFSNAPSGKGKKNPEEKFDINTEKSKKPREVEISFLKQRYGVCGIDSIVKLHYYAQYDYFEEVASLETNKKDSKPSSDKRPRRKASSTPKVSNTPNENDDTKKEHFIGNKNIPTGERIP